MGVVIGTRIDGPDFGESRHRARGTSRGRECAFDSTYAIAAAVQSALRQRTSIARPDVSTAGCLRFKLLQRDSLQPSNKALRARLPSDKHLRSPLPEELATLVPLFTRTQRRAAMPSASVAEDPSGTVVQMSASLALQEQDFSHAAERHVLVSSGWQQGHLSQWVAKSPRTGAKSVAAALSASARAPNSVLGQHWERCATVLAHDNAQSDREREIQRREISRLAQDESQSWSRTPRRKVPEVAEDEIYGHESIRSRPRLYRCRPGALSAPMSERCRPHPVDRTLRHGVCSRWQRPARSAMAETTWRAVRTELVEGGWADQQPGRPTVRVGTPKSSERAGRPLRNRSIPPTLGEVLCADSTCDSVARAPSTRAHFSNSSPYIQAADGYCP
jgi:hypothetical protein